MWSPIRRSCVGALALAAHLGAASATTIRAPRDLGELALSSDAVVVAAAGESRSRQRGSLTFTVTEFAVESEVPGRSTGEAPLEVWSPGGEEGDLGVVVDGAPHFDLGGTYLLFLSRAPGGEWCTTAMALGVLRRTERAGGVRVLEPIPQAADLMMAARSGQAALEPPSTYLEDALLSHLAAVVAGRARWDAKTAGALPTSPAVARAFSVPGGCALTQGTLQPGTTQWPTRWRSFDTPQPAPLSLLVDAAGDPDLGSAQSVTEVQRAIDAWLAVPGTRLALAVGGTTTAAAIGIDCNGAGSQTLGTNAVFFGNRCNWPLAASALAVTFTRFYVRAADVYQFGGTSWLPIADFRIVVNSGAFNRIAVADGYTVMLTHELGHGLGLDHVDDPWSLMYPALVAQMGINAATIDCIRYGYPGDNAGSPPFPPGGVEASDGAFTDRTRVTWDTASGAESYRVMRATTDDTADAELVGSATADGTFDDLTAERDVVYRYWVIADNSAGSSDFSLPDTGYFTGWAPRRPRHHGIPHVPPHP
jgi:hypothetical protein